jgi:hypothetical protein
MFSSGVFVGARDRQCVRAQTEPPATCGWHASLDSVECEQHETIRMSHNLIGLNNTARSAHASSVYLDGDWKQTSPTYLNTVRCVVKSMEPIF